MLQELLILYSSYLIIKIKISFNPDQNEYKKAQKRLNSKLHHLF